MTTPARELRLPRPLEHQQPVLDHPARFKLWRAGRRTGKSRAAFLAAVAGHGPYDTTGVRLRRGILQGAHGVWIAPDYPQSQAIWREEVKPRFAGLAGAVINESQRRVEIPGLGSLEIRSAEAIDGVRGRRLDFVICDEGAYFDLEYAWTAVLRPALADREGWAMFASTTNAGHDGNSAKRVPSYFNLLCERAERGELGADWAAFHNRTEDNARIPRAEMAALRADYPEGSAVAAQELDAELGVAGGRYYDLDATRHLVKADALPMVDGRLPEFWEYWGAYDWGYAHWAVVGLFARDTEGVITLVDAVRMRRQQDADHALAAIALCADYGLSARSLDIYAGHDCWAKVMARGGSGISTADVWADHGLYLTRADIDRANGGRALRRALAGERPQFRIVDRPARRGETVSTTRWIYRQLADTLPDPNDVNKPLKVDADADGVGGDDGSDMVRYGVATRIAVPVAPVPVVWVDPTVQDPTDLAALVALRQDDRGRGSSFDGLPGGF